MLSVIHRDTVSDMEGHAKKHLNHYGGLYISLCGFFSPEKFLLLLSI